MKISQKKIVIALSIVVGMLLISCKKNVPCPVYAKQGKVTSVQKTIELPSIKNI